MPLDGPGASGPGGGILNKLFDAGLDLGVNFGRQELLGQQPGTNQATRLGLTPGQLNESPAPSPATGGGFQLDQRTILLGLALIVGAVLLAKL